MAGGKVIILVTISLVLAGVVLVMGASQYTEKDGKKYLTIEEYGQISDWGEGLQEISIHVYRGWNLIPGFANPNWLIDSEQLTRKDIRAIYAFDPSTQSYIRLSPSPERDKLQTTKVSFDYLVSSTAFWVYTNKEADIQYFSLKDWPLDQHQLVKGWNFMAITQDIAGKSFNEVKGDCNILKLAFWDSSMLEGKGGWDDESDRLSQILSSEVKGLGVAVKVSNDCKLGEITTEIASPPQVP